MSVKTNGKVLLAKPAPRTSSTIAISSADHVLLVMICIPSALLVALQLAIAATTLHQFLVLSTAAALARAATLGLALNAKPAPNSTMPLVIVVTASPLVSTIPVAPCLANLRPLTAATTVLSPVIKISVASATAATSGLPPTPMPQLVSATSARFLMAEVIVTAALLATLAILPATASALSHKTAMEMLLVSLVMSDLAATANARTNSKATLAISAPVVTTAPTSVALA